MRSLLRRLHGADVAACAYALIYLGWLLVRTPRSPGALLIGEFAFYPLGLAVCWAHWRNLGLPGLDVRTRVAWLLLGLAALTLWGSGTAWAIYTRDGSGDWPAWLDTLELAQHFLVLGAVAALPGRQVTGGARIRFLLDLSLVVVAGFVMAFHFGLRLWLEDPASESLGSALPASALDWIVFVAVAVASLQKRDPVIRRAMGALLGASVTYLLANYCLWTQVADYRAGDWVDALWFLAWAGRYATARIGWYGRRRTAAATAEGESSRYESGALSYLVVAGAFGLLIHQIVNGDRRFLSVLALSAAAVATLLLARQLAELRENQRLFLAHQRESAERMELERQLQHAQKLDAVGHLAGGLAHDLNNILTVIRGYTELLHQDLPPGGPAGDDLAQIEEAVDRAAGLTRKVLAFSRKQAVQRTVVRLDRVVAELRPMLRQLLTDRIEASIDSDPALWPVKADQGQLEQVVINLATNARDAMPDGGALRVATENRVLAGPPDGVPGLPAGEYIALVVEDEGVGMTDEVKARVFEPFFTTKPRDRGMGLGLAMVWGIVADSGGRVLVESQPGRGTRFTVLLPRTHETAGTAPALRASPRRRASGTILVVDDEIAVRNLARRMLEGEGYEVVEAGDGVEALALLADDRLRPDLLLTDMVMPRLHGRELVARFSTLRPGVPIVCMTGFAGDADRARDHGVAVAALLTKPFSADGLRRAVATALDARSIGRLPTDVP